MFVNAIFSDHGVRQSRIGAVEAPRALEDRACQALEISTQADFEMPADTVNGDQTKTGVFKLALTCAIKLDLDEDGELALPEPLPMYVEIPMMDGFGDTAGKQRHPLHDPGADKGVSDAARVVAASPASSPMALAPQAAALPVGASRPAHAAISMSTQEPGSVFSVDDGALIRTRTVASTRVLARPSWSVLASQGVAHLNMSMSGDRVALQASRAAALPRSQAVSSRSIQRPPAERAATTASAMGFSKSGLSKPPMPWDGVEAAGATPCADAAQQWKDGQARAMATFRTSMGSSHDTNSGAGAVVVAASGVEMALVTTSEEDLGGAMRTSEMPALPQGSLADTRGENALSAPVFRPVIAAVDATQGARAESITLPVAEEEDSSGQRAASAVQALAQSGGGQLPGAFPDPVQVLEGNGRSERQVVASRSVDDSEPASTAVEESLANAPHRDTMEMTYHFSSWGPQAAVSLRRKPFVRGPVVATASDGRVHEILEDSLSQAHAPILRIPDADIPAIQLSEDTGTSPHSQDGESDTDEDAA